MVAEGRFSPDQPDRYHGLVHRVWHHDYFLVAADFDAYHAAQGCGQGLCRPRPLGPHGRDEHGACRILFLGPDDPWLHEGLWSVDAAL